MRLVIIAFLLISFTFLIFAPPGARPPDGPYSMKLTIDGQTRTYPTNPINFSSSTRIIETHVGGAFVTTKSPGTTSYSNFTITIPATTGSVVDPATYHDYGQTQLDQWYNLPSNSSSRIKDVYVRILVGSGSMQAGYMLYQVRPVSRQVSGAYIIYSFTYTAFERDMAVIPS